jgi:hypothetical protein
MTADDDKYPTTQCPSCGVRVPVHLVDAPNRCHENCPLKTKGVSDERKA